MKNILVTGGAGYIGSHTVVELVKAGYNPIIVDNFSNSQPSVLDGIAQITGRQPIFYKGDFADKKLLSAIAANHKIHGVIHFAAFKAVGESVEQPLKYYQNNVAGLISLLGFLEDRKITDLVFSSSCTVYGEPDKMPVTENVPVKPAESPYGATKQMCESIIRDTAAVSKSLKALSLRYFNPIGAHPSAAIGELPLGVPACLVPYITQTAAGIREQLTVFGNDYPTRDGTNVRDYIHVVDLAKAHVKALAFLDKQKPASYDVMNIGTGRSNTVLEVIKTFEKVSGQKLNYKIGGRRAGDIVATYASATKAKKLLGWQAEKSLADALADAWRWQQALAKNKA